MYLHEYMQEWLPAVPGLKARLEERGGKICDVGCGLGYSSFVAARSFPKVHVDGIDLDERSVEQAKSNLALENEDVRSRVSFQCSLLEEAKVAKGEYDMVTFFECLHDIPNPSEVLAQAKDLLNGEGIVLVADEGVEENLEDMLPTSADGRVGSFSENSKNFLGRLNFSFSTLHCLPAV